MAGEEGVKQKRVRRKLKLSVGQRKRQKQFIHQKNTLIKGDKYCKRKQQNVDEIECVPKKIQILDVENVTETTVTDFCSNDYNGGRRNISKWTDYYEIQTC